MSERVTWVLQYRHPRDQRYGPGVELHDKGTAFDFAERAKVDGDLHVRIVERREKVIWIHHPDENQ